MCLNECGTIVDFTIFIALQFILVSGVLSIIDDAVAVRIVSFLDLFYQDVVN